MVEPYFSDKLKQNYRLFCILKLGKKCIFKDLEKMAVISDVIVIY